MTRDGYATVGSVVAGRKRGGRLMYPRLPFGLHARDPSDQETALEGPGEGLPQSA